MFNSIKARFNKLWLLSCIKNGNNAGMPKFSNVDSSFNNLNTLIFMPKRSWIILVTIWEPKCSCFKMCNKNIPLIGKGVKISPATVLIAAHDIFFKLGFHYFLMMKTIFVTLLRRHWGFTNKFLDNSPTF